MIAAPEALEAADNVPQAAPVQPDNVQVTPLFCVSFCTVATKECVWPVCTETAVGFTVTTMAAGVAEVIVRVVTADFVASAIEVAVRVTVAGAGTVAGAVYTIAAPEALEAADNVPQVAPVHPAPANVQVTPLF